MMTKTLTPGMSFCLLMIACSPPTDSPMTEENRELRLYVMDGGTLEVSNMADFSSEGHFDGQSGTLANPSFLIRHPKGDLLWDTGYGDALAAKPDGIRQGVWHWSLETPLVDQLRRLDLQPSDIEYLALSHLHPDHSGNAGLFAESTFITGRHELEYMFTPEVKALYGEGYTPLEQSETLTFEGQHDVFGDGSVVIFEMPGHTPGSCVLLVRTQNAGNLLLTGDLYTHAEGREQNAVPTFNVDADETLKSRERFEALAAKENARVVIQHSRQDFDELPAFPDFLH